jgi:hypothetical protein
MLTLSCSLCPQPIAAAVRSACDRPPSRCWPPDTGAGGDHGIAKMWNRREISASSDCDRSHYLHPHPYRIAGVEAGHGGVLREGGPAAPAPPLAAVCAGAGGLPAALAGARIDPAGWRRCAAAVLAEIDLCGACSCQEMLRRKGRAGPSGGGGGGSGRSSIQGRASSQAQLRSALQLVPGLVAALESAMQIELRRWEVRSPVHKIRTASIMSGKVGVFPARSDHRFINRGSECCVQSSAIVRAPPPPPPPPPPHHPP